MPGVFALEVRLARLVGELSRRTGRGGGTTAPGRVLVRLRPDAIERLSGRLDDGIALLSATNGKTTTAAMAACVLAPDHALARNVGGANLVSGIASALLRAPRAARLGLLEVDEAALPAVAAATHPRVVMLANLFRDQLDRYGELELVGQRWRELVAAQPQTPLVLGADDPLVASLGEGRAGTVYFGVDDPRLSRPLDHASDSTACVRCGASYRYAAAYLGHLGDYACPRCGHARPPLELAARDVRLDGVDGSRFRVDGPDGSAEVSLAVPGLYNVYNALAAIALARALGTPTQVAAERLAAFTAAFGRFERLHVGDREAVLLLIKNPAGANEALRTIRTALEGRPLLLALNDRIADGRDVSWIWDVDYELALPAASRIVCSGTRAPDLALRARYAGVDAGRIEVVDDLAAAFDRTVELAGAGGSAFLLPTYTAMLDLQRLARERGLAPAFWEGA